MFFIYAEVFVMWVFIIWICCKGVQTSKSHNATILKHFNKLKMSTNILPTWTLSFISSHQPTILSVSNCLKMEKLYTVSKNKTQSWLWLRTCTPYCKFRLKLKKVRKTTRPFRHDLNQIPYDYTVEVTNRFKGLDLIDRVPDELWTEVCDTVQETGIMTISKKRNVKRQNGCLRRPYK